MKKRIFLKFFKLVIKCLSPSKNSERNSLSLKLSKDLNKSISELIDRFENNQKILMACSVNISDSSELIKLNPLFRRLSSNVLDSLEKVDNAEGVVFNNKLVSKENGEVVFKEVFNNSSIKNTTLKEDVDEACRVLSEKYENN